MTDPEAVDDLDATKLSHLPAAVRTHPLFRRGYNLGYSDAAHEQHLAELEDRGPRSLQDKPTSAPSYGLDTAGLLDRLAPGVRAARELLEITDKTFTTDVPCCGRRITLRIPEEDQPRPAVCCRCRVFYAVDLVEEDLDGYSDDPSQVAIFVVEHLDVAIAQHRSGKWERYLDGR